MPDAGSPRSSQQAGASEEAGRPQEPAQRRLPAAGASPAPRHGAFGGSSGSFSCCTRGGPCTGCICRNPTASTCTDRTFSFFPSTPWRCLLTGHQAAREGRQGVISAAIPLHPPPSPVVGQMQRTASAKRLLPRWTAYLVIQARGTTPVLRPNSVPVTASRRDCCAGILGISFLLAAPEQWQDERVCCPHPAPWQAISFPFWAEHHGGGRHPQLLAGVMDWQAVAVWRAVFALG